MASAENSHDGELASIDSFTTNSVHSSILNPAALKAAMYLSYLVHDVRNKSGTAV